MSRFVFVLSMTPATTVEVGTSDIVQAIAAADAALPHLHASHTDRSHVVLTAIGIAYTHTCLLCGRVNPQQPGRSLLVSIQEHLLAEHKVTIAEQTGASRVFQGTGLEGCYIWCSLKHGAYFRASRYATNDPSAGIAPRCLFSVTNLPEQIRQERHLLLRPLEGSSNFMDVRIVGVDEHAWYGFVSGEEQTTALRIWPKNRWTVPQEDAITSPSITLPR